LTAETRGILETGWDISKITFSTVPPLLGIGNPAAINISLAENIE
jgi:hypothetical protein